MCRFVAYIGQLRTNGRGVPLWTTAHNGVLRTDPKTGAETPPVNALLIHLYIGIDAQADQAQHIMLRKATKPLMLDAINELGTEVGGMETYARQLFVFEFCLYVLYLALFLLYSVLLVQEPEGTSLVDSFALGSSGRACVVLCFIIPLINLRTLSFEFNRISNHLFLSFEHTEKSTIFRIECWWCIRNYYEKILYHYINLS